jgi:hypothetical protein
MNQYQKNQIQLNDIRLKNMDLITKHKQALKQKGLISTSTINSEANPSTSTIKSFAPETDKKITLFGDENEIVQRDYNLEAKTLLRKYISDIHFLDKLVDEKLSEEQLKKLVSNFPIIQKEFFDNLQKTHLNKSDFVNSLTDLLNEKIHKSNVDLTYY